VFSVSATYDLPFGHGRPLLGNAGRALNLLIGGFQLNTTTNISTGLPYGVSYSECNSDRDTGPCRPILLGSLSSEAGSYDPLNQKVPFFTPVAPLANNGDIAGDFQRPQKGTFGSGRNAFTGPGYWNSDVSLFKNFSITERFSGQFRLEAFNAFNHVNLGLPNNCIDCSSGGVITSTQPTHGDGVPSMRQLNFGIRFAF
jgi:hypothetical protein